MDWHSQPADRFGTEGPWGVEPDGRGVSGLGSGSGRAEMRPKRWVLHASHGGGGPAGPSAHGPHFAPGSSDR